MEKRTLLACLLALFLMNGAMAQQSKIRMGMSAQYSYMLLMEPYQWHVRVEGYEPGSFMQMGMRADIQLSPRLSIKTGLQLGRYHYKEEQNETLIFFDGQFFDDGPFILPPHELKVDNQRNFTMISIPVLLQYHLEDLVPGKIKLSFAAGVSPNANTRNFIEKGNEFQQTLTKYSLDGLIGPEISFLTKSGQLSIAPLLRVALTNYSNLQELDGIFFANARELRPYSAGLEVSYLWNL